jgi:predicted phage terminase large subunit-like protein
MSEPVDLSDVPHRFLDPRAWATLRSFAPNDLLALIYINAPYPNEAEPNDFFWDRPRSASDPLNCCKIIDRRTADALYRVSFGAFAYAAYAALYPNRPLVPNWHIKCICHHLQEMSRQLEVKRSIAIETRAVSNNLVINLPPRALKSFLISVGWVAWMLGRNPNLQVICASYSEDLAHKFSRDCRALMESQFYKRVFRTRINPRKSTETEFETTRRGFRLATSTGATLTGRGADIFIIDDPTKSNDAGSEVALEAANEWFRSTALSRRNNPAKTLMLVVQQRLHTNDLSGSLIELGWPSLAMPAIATEARDYAIAEGEIYHRLAGELLQPDWDSREELEKIKIEIGSRNFAAQYQQNPTPADGNQIKAAWLRRYDSRPPCDKFRSIILSCDPAGKTGVKNDYTAMTVIGIGAKELYLLHVERGHWTVLEMKARITTLSSQWNATHIIIEDTASGMGLIQLLREQTQLPVIGQHPTDDKETRMSRHEGRFEAGRILLPTEALWLADFETELLAFPNGRYDDQVDALMLTLDWFARNEHCLPPSSWPIPFVFSRPRNIPGSYYG